MAAMLVQQDIISDNYDVRKRTVHTATNNTPMLFWHQLVSVSMNTTLAYLLRMQALHQRFHCYVLTHSYLPSPLNHMGNDASRRWDLSDAELLTHFDLSYPQPMPWQLYHPNSAMLSAMTSALCRKRLLPESFLTKPLPLADNGPDGRSSAEPYRWILPSRRSRTPLRSCKSMPTDTVLECLPPVVTLSALEQWRTPYVPSVKHSQQWGLMTYA
jgi:hypothetical protein